MKKAVTYLLVFLCVVLLASCKKDETPPPSKVNVLSPGANTSFQVFDTIEIKLLIESQQPEVGLRISLLNANYSPASPMKPLDVSSFETNVEATLHFLLDHKYLESGNYYLYFKVTDQSGTVNTYRGIYIEGIQRAFEGVFIISEISANQTGIEKLGIDLAGEGIKIMAGNYAGSAIDPRNRNVFLAGKNSGNLTALNIDSLSFEWEVPIIPNPVQPYFTFLQQIGEVLYAGFYSGEVNGYNPSGDLIFTTHTDGLTFPNLMCIAGNLLVVSSTSRSNAFEYWLETYFLASGVSNSKTKLLIKPIHLKAHEDKKVLVFGNNQNSHIKTKLLDPETGLLTDPYQAFSLPDEKLKCAANISQGLTLLGLESGIYLYDYQRSISVLATSLSPDILQYEDISQTIVAANETSFFVLSTNGQILSEHEYPYPILNLLLHYNK